MKYIKRFESLDFNDIKYNIECLLMDIIDSGFKVDIRKYGVMFRINISTTRGEWPNRHKPTKRFDNIANYLLSLIDYMESVNYRYYGLSVVTGNGNKEIFCEIVDDKLKNKFKENGFIGEYLITNIRIEFTKPLPRRV